MPDTKTALIIGASRGLGLGLARELLSRGWHVTATVRGTGKSTGLEDYADQVAMDVVDITDLASVKPFVTRALDHKYDVVFINAGIGGPREKTVTDVTADEISHLFMTNAIAPVRLAERLLPAVKADGVLAIMSSRLGSVSLAAGSMPLYSASKAALNSLTKAFVAGLGKTGVTVLTMHPGWVRTDMGGAGAPLDVKTSVRGIADVLESKGGAAGHEFLDYEGKTLPW
jgi:NAD(P)-dependent dehydrogenase (short-subunit alcohol dehydrogenase family)